MSTSDSILQTLFAPDGGDENCPPVDYSTLERAHKQDGWYQDQQEHYELGWRACYQQMKSSYQGAKP